VKAVAGIVAAAGVGLAAVGSTVGSGAAGAAAAAADAAARTAAAAAGRRSTTASAAAGRRSTAATWVPTSSHGVDVLTARACGSHDSRSEKDNQGGLHQCGLLSDMKMTAAAFALPLGRSNPAAP